MFKRVLVALAVWMSVSAVSLRAQTPDGEERLQFHGYLTQGIGGTSGEPIFGLNKETTTEYRRAALQFRYAVTEHDGFVVQVGGRRMGSSLLNSAAPALSLDWAYYRREEGPFRFKVGKAPMPFGLYNEKRSVGTLVPFFRAPGNFYMEGFETITGAVAEYGHELHGWGVELSAFGGDQELNDVRWTPQGGAVTTTRVGPTVGGQVWLQTPVEGVRVGGAFITTQLPDQGDRDVKITLGSVDVTRNRFFVRAEANSMRIDAVDMTRTTGYVQGGVTVYGPLTLVGQSERQHIKSGAMKIDQARDDAAGINVRLNANLVLKFEGHKAKGYNFDRFVNPLGPAAEGKYYLGSLSVAF